MFSADVEVEEMDLGNDAQDDELIDDGNPPRDLSPEALETDEEEEENEELGIDLEDTEGRLKLPASFPVLILSHQFPCTCFHYIRYYRPNSKCGYFNLRRKGRDSS